MEVSDSGAALMTPISIKALQLQRLCLGLPRLSPLSKRKTSGRLFFKRCKGKLGPLTLISAFEVRAGGLWTKAVLSYIKPVQSEAQPSPRKGKDMMSKRIQHSMTPVISELFLAHTDMSTLDH